MWHPYTKQILSANMTVSDVLTGILFYLVYFSILIFIFKFCFCERKEFNTKQILISYGILFSTQLIFDLIKTSLNNLFEHYSYLIIDPLNVIIGCLHFVLLLKLTKSTAREEYNKKTFYSVCSLASLILIGFEIFNLIDAIKISNIIAKYDSSSSVYKSYMLNNSFRHEISSLAVESICIALLFVAIYVKYHHVREQSEDSQKSTEIAKLVLRIFIVIAAGFLITRIKFIILPHGCITKLNAINGNTINYNQEDPFDTDTNNFSISRNLNSEDVCVYRIITVRFEGLNDYCYYTYNMDIDPLDFIVNDSFEVYGVSKHYQYFNDLNTDFRCYGNELLIIHQDETKTFRIIKLTELSKSPYDEDIVKCCEYMIKKGVFSYFEYGCEYLQKYSPEFIEPYIEKYSNGIFSYKELENPYNYAVKTDYIVTLAKKYSQ